MKERSKLILTSFSLICMIILSNSIASLLGGIGHYFFYHIIYWVVISICVPIYFFRKEDNGDLSLLGIKKLRVVDYIIIIGFVAFSIGGQLIDVKLDTLNFALLPLCIAPFIMSTFCEEFFFRGFLQIRFEKAFGAIPAIILSGLFFSIYHLGYPGFRNIEMTILMFFVGILFALPFKLSNNNVIVAYFVNLPNCFLTYLLRAEQYPAFNFTEQATIVSIFLIAITGFIVVKGLSNGKNTLQNAQIGE